MNFLILAFPINFWLFKTVSFKNWQIKVARFARNVKCDFFSDFQTLCTRRCQPEFYKCESLFYASPVPFLNHLASPEFKSDLGKYDLKFKQKGQGFHKRCGSGLSFPFEPFLHWLKNKKKVSFASEASYIHHFSGQKIIGRFGEFW